MKKKVWKPKRVTVEWLDASAQVELHGTLNAVLDQARLKRRESQGWLLRYDDQLTVIARDYDAPEEDGEEPETGDTQTMPSILVLSVRQGNRRVKKDGDQGSEAQAGSGAPRADEGSAAKPRGRRGGGVRADAPDGRSPDGAQAEGLAGGADGHGAD